MKLFRPRLVRSLSDTSSRRPNPDLVTSFPSMLPRIGESISETADSDYASARSSRASSSERGRIRKLSACDDMPLGMTRRLTKAHRSMSVSSPHMASGGNWSDDDDDDQSALASSSSGTVSIDAWNSQRTVEDVRPPSDVNLLLPLKRGSTNRITTHTVVDLLKGEHKAHFDDFVVIDCRYNYEFKGGHVPTAHNILLKEHLTAFYHSKRAECKAKGRDCQRVAIIFHCEYSKHRGPRACRFWRNIDRENNSYPNLSFPQLFVMDGGYRQFYSNYPNVADGAYISMWDSNFQKQCKSQTSLHRRSWHSNSKKGKIGRYAKRQRSHSVTQPCGQH